MSPYSKRNSVNDIEKPISSNIHGRDILGINLNIPAMSKSTLDLEDEQLAQENISKIK